MTQEKGIGLPYLCAGFVVVLWSFGSLVGKLLTEAPTPLATLLTLFFTLLTFTIPTLIKGEFKDVLKLCIDKPTALLIAPAGYFIYWVFYFEAFNNLPNASTAMMLNYTWPIFTALFIRLLSGTYGIKTYLNELVGLFLGFAGITVLFISQGISFNEASLYGIVCGLGAGASYGLYGAFASRLSANQGKSFLVLSIVSGFLLSFITSINYLDIIPSLSTRFWITAFASGVILDGIGYYLWIVALRLAGERYIPPGAIVSFGFFLPLTSLPVLRLFFGESEPLNLATLIAALLVVLGSLVCSRKKQAL